MSYLALYRKYRPKTFADVAGQEFVTKALKNAIKKQQVHHAYIFAGPKGIGKTTIAKIFAKAINCLHPIDGDACDKCKSCIDINNNQTTDIMELDAASNNGVDDVRNIIDNTRFLPTSLKKKVYIIDEAHMLTTQAWNAMLKTIEEAPDYVVFIFATTEIHKIPATILSRCQQFVFHLLTKKQLHTMILHIANKENIKIENEAISKIIDLSNGSGRDCLSMLEQLAMYTDNNITNKSVNDIYGLLDDSNKLNLLNLIINKDTPKILELLDYYSENGINFTHLSFEIITILLDVLVYSQTKNLELLKKLNSNNIKDINLTEDKCLKLINVWQEQYMRMRNSNEPSFYFRLCIFNSINVFENTQNINKKDVNVVIKQETIVETKKININEIKVEQKPANELPSIDNVFKTTDITSKYIKPLISTPVVEVVKTDDKLEVIKSNNVSPIVDPTSNLKDLFNGIAYNRNRTYEDTARKILTHITPRQYEDIKELRYLKEYQSVFIASKNGLILLFKDELDVEVLEKHNTTAPFLEAIKTIFGKVMYVIGLTMEQKNKLGREFQLLKKEGKIFDEPNVSKLKEILGEGDQVFKMGKELFFS